MPRPEPASAPPLPPGDSRPLAGLTLLAVEDSRFTCEALRLLCLRGGARLRRAEGLLAARAHLRLYRPDVALIDLGLPDGRGEDLLAELAVLPARPALIAMSGCGDGSTAAADAFLEKPLPGPERMVALILSLLHRRAPVAGAIAVTVAPPDPLALQDDLRLAARMLGRRDATFVAGFVQGLARSACDPALEAAAIELGRSGRGTSRLRHLIAARLAPPGSGPGSGFRPGQPGPQAP